MGFKVSTDSFQLCASWRESDRHTNRDVHCFQAEDISKRAASLPQGTRGHAVGFRVGKGSKSVFAGGRVSGWDAFVPRERLGER